MFKYSNKITPLLVTSARVDKCREHTSQLQNSFKNAYMHNNWKMTLDINIKINKVPSQEIFFKKYFNLIIIFKSYAGKI